MGFMINKTTYEIQTCPSEEVMVDNGWNPEEWTFEEDLDSVINLDGYKAKMLAIQNTAKKQELQSQIDLFDMKSVRALREGGIKDEVTGQTWVEYYTEQIQGLRAQIAAL